MARRLPQTLADYLVIAISPALIMALVGSLMFFLLRVFYQGEFGERLHWVMTCFVFAAVLIARISIEDGFERAAPFGAALAILVGIAANRFMEYRGDWVDDFGWIINFGIIGLVWWCIHQLTWDCTVIDEDQDASGEGLMQVVGLERPADAGNASGVSPEKEIEGTTSREVPAGFWQRYLQSQRQPHTPGVWVVYFSLAALPIFGIGQWFIPASDVAGRRYVFWLLGVYVASGLALLVTTSFLGLRRYLRQRRIEMPTTMANLWLATGGAIIAVLLVMAALLPRPSAEYAISQLPFTVGSPDQEASDAALSSRNGTKDEDSQARGEADPNADPNQEPTADSKGSKAGGEGSGEKSGGEGKSSDAKGSSGSQDKSGKASAKGSEQQQPDGGEPQSSDRSKSSDQSQGNGEAAEQQAQQQPGEGKQREPSSGKNPLENMKKFRELERELAAKYEDKPKDEEDQEKSDEQQQESEAEAAEADSPEMPPIEPPLGPLATILQYVFYGVVILGTLFAVWYYWREILAGVRNFLKELAEWWRTLWGAKRVAQVAAEGPLDIRVPPPAFASFADPFASGTAARMSPEELVRYSFSAFEAWSGEHGCPHEPDQTPHELVREVARLNSHIAADARNLAELYARAAFARGQLPPNTSDQLAALWRQMTLSLRVSV